VSESISRRRKYGSRGSATHKYGHQATAVVAPCQSRLGSPRCRRSLRDLLIDGLSSGDNARGAVWVPPQSEVAGDGAAGVAGDDADWTAAAGDGRRRVAGGHAVLGRPGQPRAPDSAVARQPVAQLEGADVQRRVHLSMHLRPVAWKASADCT
jgi:hypothetical protein